MIGWPRNEAQNRALEALIVLQDTLGENATIAFLEHELRRIYVKQQLRFAVKHAIEAESRAGNLEKRLTAAVKALEFYANDENYSRLTSESVIQAESAIQKDSGRTARLALAEITDDSDDGANGGKS
jgi:hypothetical protein